METTGTRHKSACTEGFHGYCAHTSKRFFGFKVQKGTDSLELLTGHREAAAGSHGGATAHHSPLGGLNLQPLPRLNQEGGLRRQRQPHSQGQRQPRDPLGLLFLCQQRTRTRGEVVIYVASSHHTPVMCPGWRDAKGLLRGWAQYLACFLQCQRIQEHLSHR